MISEIVSGVNAAGVSCYKVYFGEGANCVSVEIDSEEIEQAILDACRLSACIHGKGKGLVISSVGSLGADKVTTISFDQIIRDEIKHGTPEDYAKFCKHIRDFGSQAFHAGRDAGFLPDPFDALEPLVWEAAP